MKKSIRAAMVVVILAAATALSACIIAGGSSFNEVEPNDLTSEATVLTLDSLGEVTVYAQLSDSDSTDFFSFNNGSHSTVNFEIIVMDSDLGYDINYILTRGGSTIIDGDGDDYLSFPGQPLSSNYNLKISLDTYSSGGKYVVLIRCF